MVNSLDQFKPVTNNWSSSLGRSSNKLDKYKPKPSMFREEEDEDDPLTIQQWAKDKNRMDNLRDYMFKRHGESGQQETDETDEDYVKRFMTHARRFETNSIGIMGQIDYLRGANEEDRKQFGYLYNSYNRLPGMGETGGDSTARTIKDYLGAAILDPINILGFGAAKIGTAVVGKMAIKEGLKRFVPKNNVTQAIIGGSISGAGYGAMYNLADQDIKRKSYMTDAEGNPLTPDAEIDLMSTAFESIMFAGIGGALGGTLVGTAKLLGKSKTQKKQAEEAKKILEKEDLETIDPIEGRVIRQDRLDEAERLIKKQQERLQKKQKVEDDFIGPLTEGQMKRRQRDIKRQQQAEKQGFTEPPNTKKLDPTSAKEKLDQNILTKQEILRQPPIVDAKVLVDLSIKMGKIVLDIAKAQRDKGVPIILKQRAKKDKRVSDTVMNVVRNIDKIDEDVLESALSRQGLTTKDLLDFLQTTDEFAVMERMSIREAAKMLGARGQLGKLRKTLTNLSPDLKQRLDDSYGASEEVGSALGSFYGFMKRLDRERRALMVTQIATTARNVATGLTVISFETLANTMEASLYHGGRALRGAFKGNASGEAFAQGLRDWTKDSFGLAVAFAQQGKSKEMSDLLLRHNPKIAKIIFRTLGDVGPDETETLTAFSRYANYLNLTQDAMFRRAFFSDYVLRNMRRADIPLDEREFGKRIDVDLLQGGMEYALRNTFAFMPKQGPAHHFVRFVESFPMVPVIGTGEFPFARFMANAMAFQLKYNPLNGAYGLFQGAIQLGMKGAGKEVSEGALRASRQRMSQGMVGSAALGTAIYFRSKNQDTEWYNVKTPDGRTIDMRPFFPAAPYMIVADMIIKYTNGELDKLKGKDFIDGFTGAQFRAGAASYTVDKLYEVIGAEGGLESIGTEKLGEILGGYVGEVTAGFLTPARVVKDVVAAFDEEEAIVRDSNSVDGIGAKDRAVHAFINKLYKGIPYASQTLPEFESPSREATVRTQSPILGQFLGLRFRERANSAESELTRLGYKSFELLPTTGDKIADRLTKEQLGPLIEEHIGSLVESDAYKKKTEPEKLAAVKIYLKDLRKIAKLIGEVEAQKLSKKGTIVSFTPFDRSQWQKTPRNARKLANDYYKKYFKTTVEQSGDYRRGAMIGRLLARQL